MSLYLVSKAVAFTLTLLLLPFLIFKIGSAQTVYFQDGFDDGDANGWSIDLNSCFYQGSPTEWIVINQEYGALIDSGSCQTYSIPTMVNIAPLNNYSVEVDVAMRPSINMDRAFFFAYKDRYNWYSIHTVGTNININKYINGAEYFLPGKTKSYDFVDGTAYKFRVDILNQHIKVYVDNVLVMDVLDYSPFLTEGKFGLAAVAGYIPDSEVWFDNIVVTSIPEPTPTPTPNPNLFDLPFNYPGRPTATLEQFKTAFWGRLTAAFDHVYQTDIFRPFTGATYLPTDCLLGVLGIGCYDSHNGTDFYKNTSDPYVYPVNNGMIVYSSEVALSGCKPEHGGFGCVVIVQHPNNIYTLYAHLSQITRGAGQAVTKTEALGTMGNTGCPTCGQHLHLGVLKPIDMGVQEASRRMTKADWKALIHEIKPTSTPQYRPSCTYRAPNHIRFYFQDPSGWKGSDSDPWSLSKAQGGCGVTSPYLWKFDVGTSL